MPEIGEPSRTVEEEPRDVHVVYEQAVVADPAPAIIVEGQEFEPASEPEEGPGEGDGNPDPPEEVIETLLDQNSELENRVDELEQERQQQQMALEQQESLIQLLITKSAELSGKCRDTERELVRVRVDRDNLHTRLGDVTESRGRLFDAWNLTTGRVDRLETEVRAKKVKIDAMSYAFNTAFGRWEDRVWKYPAEEGQTRHTMSRRLMIQIGRQEYEDALQRGMRQ